MKLWLWRIVQARVSLFVLDFYHVLVFTNTDLSEYYKQTLTFEKTQHRFL